MKKKLWIFFTSVILVLVLALVLVLRACAKDDLEMVIMDYKTEDVILELSDEKNHEQLAAINDAIFSNTTNAPSDGVSAQPTYSVLLNAPKGTYYDAWIKVIFEDNEVYFCYDENKMDKEYFDSYFADVGFYKCVGITVDEFEDLILNCEVGK